MARTYRRIFGLVAALFFTCAQPVMANPVLYLRGSHVGITDFDQTWDVMLHTDGDTISVLQTVLHYNQQYLYPTRISTLNSICSFWAPADPSLGLGNSATPYFSGGNKVVLSCGLANPGYKTVSTTGDIVAHVVFRVYTPGTTSFSFSDTQFRLNGQAIAASASGVFDLTIYGSSVEAQRAQYPPPDVASESAIYRSTPQPIDTLRASDLNFVDVNSSTRSGSRTGSNMAGSTAEGVDTVDLDNQIPPPPADMSPRPKATPYDFPDVNSTNLNNEGEVLSLQSLRELLIPGKSSADKTLVVFNLISTLTFITLLAILIWRMIVSARSNKLKYKHMNDLLEGELAVLESKLEGSDPEHGQAEGERTLEQLRKDLERQRS